MLLVCKIVDDFYMTGTDTALRQFINAFNLHFKLGEVVHGPGTLRFFGMNIIQNEDYSISIHADDKLKQLEPFPISRSRRRQVDDKMNDIEKKSFMSINASIGWLGTNASILCSFYSFHLQQKIADCHVSALISQFSALRTLKKHGTLTTFAPVQYPNNDLTIVAFSDASHSPKASQLCYIIGLVIGEVKKGSPFHVLSWSSHRSRRPAKSTPAAEILAASEAVEETVILKDVMTSVLGKPVKSMVFFDSKDLFGSLSSKRNPTDKSVRNDVNLMRFYFETSIDVFGWIAGSVNPADVGTKKDSPLTELLVLTLATGIIHIDFVNCEFSHRDKSYG